MRRERYSTRWSWKGPFYLTAVQESYVLVVSSDGALSNRLLLDVYAMRSLWSAGARLVSLSAHVNLMLGKLRYQLFRRFSVLRVPIRLFSLC